MVLSSNLSFAAGDREWSEAMEAGNRLYQQGQLEAAEKKYLEALKIAEAFAENDGRLASTLSGLGVAYGAQGKYTEAEGVTLKAIAVREKASGSLHPDLANDLANLAMIYGRQRQKSAEAEALSLRSLAILEKAFGPESVVVARSLNNLAGLYEMQARYADAERICGVWQSWKRPNKPKELSLPRRWPTLRPYSS